MEGHILGHFGLDGGTFLDGPLSIQLALGSSPMAGMGMWL